ncbi:J domain-containing protein required for chloroplast accumulation response 1-like [Cucurbita moschata]|uniref:J domain-containing protein required for chloroplast accumulation response 1-like n=1 Tax=Cucurbita moschata TaxID=3662 RepID=A0A6J1F956_CUCMO|nr:J domain-containing protein required for chloroplast accumulation response 1-like [Cucurbita moschata]
MESDDVDFHDVFGGPPRRRSSVHETRYSFSETVDSFALKRRDDEAPSGRSSRWSGLNEKPVFGEEGVHGRRFPSNDFYDDIFQADESVSSSPRRHERDLFSSTPGSGILSPARPLPPPVEPFGSSSLPAQLSLPSRLAKGTDLPAFGSNPSRNKDGGLNGSHTNSPRFTLSRFSSSTSSHRSGLLSSEFQERGSEEASSFRKSDSNAMSGNSSTKGVDSLEDSNGSGQFQFHFSIYKWASKGVPLMMPLRGGNGSRSRSKTMIRRSSSSTDRVVKNKNEMHSPTSTIQHIDFPLVFHETANVDDEKGTGLLPDIAGVDQRKAGGSFEEAISAAPSENLSRQTSLRNSKMKTPSFLSADMESGHNIGRKKAGGKISEFVKIFNQVPASKPRDVVDLANDSSTRKQESASKAQTEATVNKIRKDEKPKLNKNTDASTKGDDVSKQSVDDHSAKKAASYRSPAPNTVHVPGVAKSTTPDVEEPFQEHFSVKELPQDYDDSRVTDNGREGLQAIDTKIRHWSNGKEGNIRSLLSTLQYVLWPKSGWKAVPLVDIIDGHAVKRSYQKALLYLHPDKLQQKGASSDQKYIAAKVFEILQEAWTHFNTLSGQ